MTVSSFALSNVAQVIRGVSFDKDESKDDPQEGYVPIIRAGNISDRLDLVEDLIWVPEHRVSMEQCLRMNDVVICMSSGSKTVVGKCAPVEKDWFGSVGAFCAIIRPKPNCVVPAFLSYFLKSPTFRQWTSQSEGVNIKNIRKSELESYKLSFPSFDEQRRLVDILSRAEGIVRLRREAQKRAQELIPALFLDMFGDPATNPRGWPIHRVSDFVARFEGGKNLQAGSEAGTKYRILKVSAVTSGIYRESESKPAPDRYIAPSNHFVRKGDLLFSRANTEELVGATALVEETNGTTLLPDKLWRFVWSLPVEPLYIFALFQSAYVRREMGKLSSGTSSSMRNISQAKLFSLALPVAPIDTQKAFSERLEQIRSIQSQQSIALEKAEATFQSLLYRAFAGQL